MFTITPDIERLIDRSLDEDLGFGDLTTEAIVPDSLRVMGSIVAKTNGVLAGLDLARSVLRKVDSAIEFNPLIQDGEDLKSDGCIAEIEGTASSILKAERTVINYLQRLSGIATETARYAQAVKGYPTRILDTRKTTPGMRALEKYAVSIGGGYNHRRGLGDAILIKDNHIEVMRQTGMELGDIVAKARSVAPHYLKVEVEVENLEEVYEALDAGAEILLLDNMTLEEMAEAVKWVCGRAMIEASGGITLSNVQNVAATGVDFISVGALTHSSNALDISLDLIKVV